MEGFEEFLLYDRPMLGTKGDVMVDVVGNAAG